MLVEIISELWANFNFLHYKFTGFCIFWFFYNEYKVFLHYGKTLREKVRRIIAGFHDSN